MIDFFKGKESWVSIVEDMALESNSAIDERRSSIDH
jgi:hypothetical protein